MVLGPNLAVILSQVMRLAVAWTRHTMSKFTGPSPHANIASKTVFAALDVDAGEDTEEEQITDQDSPSAHDRYVVEFVLSAQPKSAENNLVQCARANETD